MFLFVLEQPRVENSSMGPTGGNSSNWLKACPGWYLSMIYVYKLFYCQDHRENNRVYEYDIAAPLRGRASPKGWCTTSPNGWDTNSPKGWYTTSPKGRGIHFR